MKIRPVKAEFFHADRGILLLIKTEKNRRMPKVARNVTAFGSLVLFLVDGPDSTHE
jgi:hypothetical protein